MTNVKTASGTPGTTGAKATTLVALRDAKDFHLPSTWPDVRTWNVVGNDGVTVGTVSRLLIDPHAKALRYLDVVIGKVGNDTQRFIVPVGMAVAEPPAKRVRLTNLRASEVGKLPMLTAESVTMQQELDAVKAFGGKATDQQGLNTAYTQPMFDPKLLFTQGK